MRPKREIGILAALPLTEPIWRTAFMHFSTLLVKASAVIFYVRPLSFSLLFACLHGVLPGGFGGHTYLFLFFFCGGMWLAAGVCASSVNEGKSPRASCAGTARCCGLIVRGARLPPWLLCWQTSETRSLEPEPPRGRWYGASVSLQPSCLTLSFLSLLSLSPRTMQNFTWRVHKVYIGSKGV